MNCHGHTGARQWWMVPAPPQSRLFTSWRGCGGGRHCRPSFHLRSPRRNSCWRKLGDEKLMCSWWASMPLPFETFEIPELVEGEWDVLLSVHRFLPKAILLTPPVVGVWREGRAFCCSSWSSFLLRKRPPGPRTRFIAWRCRDSWRYGWEEKGRKNSHWLIYPRENVQTVCLMDG